MRKAETYRGARRNAWRDEKGKFPWNGGWAKVTIHKAEPVRPNQRDRSETADARRRRRNMPVDFTRLLGWFMPRARL